ncbi:hypothetical protein GXW82_32550 [Streptacidiphilus sp. 4-A2]|nr:hypothetical protein [Streptacidiphilus sp. 4-A2]
MTGIDRVRAALEQQDVEPSHEELLDILWLARAVALDDGTTVSRWANGTGTAADPSPAADAPRTGEAGGGTDPAPGGREQLHVPAGNSGPAGPGTSGPGRPVQVPGHHPISNPILLRRALRPLRRYRRPSWTPQLDETATANLIAETSVLELVHRPEALRSKDLLLVVDDGTSMRLWQDLAAELHRLLRNLGAFRRVIAVGLDSDRADRAVIHTRPFGVRPGSLPRRGGPRHSPAVLVLSDGVGAGWRSGAMQEFLERQCAHSPVALLQPLPPTLWSGTALRPTRLELTAPVGGPPNQRLRSSDPLLPDIVTVLPAVPVPLIELSAVQLRDWAVLATVGGTVTLPVIDARAPAPPQQPAGGGSGTGAGAAAGAEAGQPSAEGRLAAFRATASPQAYRLAAHLSTVQPLTLPVMRVVQEAVLPRSHPGYLAEVFLGGLLQATSTCATPADAVYALHPGVAELLMSAVDTGDALNTVQVVSDFLERPTARTASMSAVLADPHGSGRLPAIGHALAEVGGPFLRYLGILPPAPVVRPAAVGAAPESVGSTPAQLRQELRAERSRSGPHHPAVAVLELRLAIVLADGDDLRETASLVKAVLEAQRLHPAPGRRPTAAEERLLLTLVERLSLHKGPPALLGEAISLAAALNPVPKLHPLDWLIDALCPPTRPVDAGYQLTRVRAAFSRTGDNTNALLTALAELAEALNVPLMAAAYRRGLSPLSVRTTAPAPAAWEPDLPRPYFYLSYAHTFGPGRAVRTRTPRCAGCSRTCARRSWR